MEKELKRAKDGRSICPNCSKPIDAITQAYYDCYEWDAKLKKYCKTEWPGSCQNPVCGKCGEYLDTKYTRLLNDENKK